jgi:phosphoglycerate-specific signal transduction histidine kinase
VLVIKKKTCFNGKIALHLALCDNEATDLQYAILAQQLPSMNQRIADSIQTRVTLSILLQLPNAKINFVSEELAKDLHLLSFHLTCQKEILRENLKRELNLKLINLMITKIPNESKFCVSYGQLKDVIGLFQQPQHRNN